MNDSARSQLPTKRTTAFRLPWNPAFEEEFGEIGVHSSSWRTVIDTVWPGAKTVESVVMALGYCRARNLDPFKRPVHIVPVWDSKKRAEVETVWPGISELRTTAIRTGEYAGKDAVEFGPMITEKIGATSITFPEWAKMTVYRIVHGQRVAFEGDQIYWMESYARKGKDIDPNYMWQRRPRGQIAKCAEAHALRQAFPEEIGSDYTAEEMEGQIIGAAEVAPPPEKKPLKLNAQRKAEKPAGKGKAAEEPDIIEGEVGDEGPPAGQGRDPDPPDDEAAAAADGDPPETEASENPAPADDDGGPDEDNGEDLPDDDLDDLELIASLDEKKTDKARKGWFDYHRSALRRIAETGGPRSRKMAGQLIEKFEGAST